MGHPKDVGELLKLMGHALGIETVRQGYECRIKFPRLPHTCGRKASAENTATGWIIWVTP